MIHNLDNWYADPLVIVLIATAAMGIMTVVTFFREFKKNSGAAMVYFTLSAFLWVLHGIWISFAPPESILFHSSPDFWQWLVYLFSPALVIVFFIQAAYWYAKSGGWPALIRIFLGMTLACVLSLIGQDLSVPVKGAMTLLWVFFMWQVEFPPKPKRSPLILVTRRLL